MALQIYECNVLSDHDSDKECEASCSRKPHGVEVESTQQQEILTVLNSDYSIRVYQVHRKLHSTRAESSCNLYHHSQRFTLSDFSLDPERNI